MAITAEMRERIEAFASFVEATKDLVELAEPPVSRERVQR